MRLRRLAQRRHVGEVLLEGPRVIAEAAAAGVRIELLALREGTEFAVESERTVVLSRGLFRSLSQVDTPQGVLAIGRLEETGLDEALAAARAAGWPLVVLDAVQDPGNAGAIARTCAAAGAPALVALPGTADLHAAKAVRASAGNVFHLVIARATWEDLAGLKTVGAVATGGVSPAEIEWKGVDAIVFGSEAHGLSHPTAERVTIPVEVESLNVAAAAAVLLFGAREAKA